jgi:hypothetical protein
MPIKLVHPTPKRWRNLYPTSKMMRNTNHIRTHWLNWIKHIMLHSAKTITWRLQLVTSISTIIWYLYMWDCFYNHQQPCPMCSSHAGTSTSTSDMYLFPYWIACKSYMQEVETRKTETGNWKENCSSCIIT